MSSTQPAQPSRPDLRSVRRLGGRLVRRTRGVAARRGRTPEARLLATGLFVPAYYRHQVRKRFLDDLAAARHYLATGAARGALPNPLQDFWTAFPGEVPAGQVAEALLAGDGATIPALPLLDVVAYTTAVPSAADHPGGPVGHYLQAALSDGNGFPLVRGQQRTTWAKEMARSGRHARASRLIAAAGVFDVGYYSTQRGLDYTGLDAAAVWNYVQHGEPGGLAPSVLFEPSWYRAQASISGADALAHSLRNAPASTGPQFDGVAWSSAHPEALEHPGGPLGHFLSVVDRTAPLPAVPGVRPTTLDDLTHRLHELERERVQATRALTPPSFVEGALPGPDAPVPQVDVLTDVSAWGSAQDVLKALKTLDEQTHDRWSLTVVVESRPGHEDDRVSELLAEVVRERPDLHVVPSPGRSAGARANDVLPALDGEVVMFWGGAEHWDPGLVATLASTAAAAPGGVAHCAVRFDHRKPEQRARHLPPHVAVDGPLAAPADFAWSAPRSLAGFAMTRAWLGDEPFDAAREHFGWELLVRRRPDLDPAFVPAVGLVERGLEPTGRRDLHSALANSDHNVTRAREVMDWDALRAGLGDRVAGRTSMLIPTWRDWSMTRRAVEAVLSRSGDLDVEVVVLDNGSGREVAALLEAEFGTVPAVTVVPCAVNTHYSTGSNLAFAHSTGRTVVFLNNDTVAQDGWLPPLLDALEQPGVIGSQPLLMYPEGTIQTAGTVFHGPSVLPWHFLMGHPLEDAPTGTATDFAAITGACLVMRADHVAEMEGMDPLFVNGFEDVDLCLRAREHYDGSFAVAYDSRVLHDESRTPGRHFSLFGNHVSFASRWLRDMPPPEHERFARAGFDLEHVRIGSRQPLTPLRVGTVQLLVRHPQTVESGPAAGLPRLRWAVKVDAPALPAVDHHLAEGTATALAGALRELGQEVVVDHLGAHVRDRSDYLDEVQLVLREGTSVAQQPVATSVLWVRGDADDVTDAELASYDLLLAAGTRTASSLAERSGREVEVLLPGVDAEAARGSSAGDDTSLVVGAADDASRAIVDALGAAGLPVAVAGAGWTASPGVELLGLGPTSSELADRYRGSRAVVVPAVAGSVPQAAADALAAGARVVLVGGDVDDDLPGLLSVADADALVARLTGDLDGWAGGAQPSADATVQARARRLLAAVLDARGVEHGLER